MAKQGTCTREVGGHGRETKIQLLKKIVGHDEKQMRIGSRRIMFYG
jgi:hypothetical protein